MTKSNYSEFRQQASLSQQLADNDSIYQELAGNDPQISESIGVLRILIDNKIIPNDSETQLILDILNVIRKARFATSEKVNEITKLGLQMPRRESVYDGELDR